MLINMYYPYISTQFGDFSSENESRNAKIFWLIKRYIMRIFDEAEPLLLNSPQIAKWFVKNYGRERINDDFEVGKCEKKSQFFGDGLRPKIQQFFTLINNDCTHLRSYMRSQNTVCQTDELELMIIKHSISVGNWSVYCTRLALDVWTHSLVLFGNCNLKHMCCLMLV